MVRIGEINLATVEGGKERKKESGAEADKKEDQIAEEEEDGKKRKFTDIEGE